MNTLTLACRRAIAVDQSRNFILHCHIIAHKVGQAKPLRLASVNDVANKSKPPEHALVKRFFKETCVMGLTLSACWAGKPNVASLEANTTVEIATKVIIEARIGPLQTLTMNMGRLSTIS
eukprot:CAMPEP_0115672798 /NCGR_PEP_ID=MMETSP0272-20121206/52771_1 /TAXON_ID=71861 /ORGANISM="Scrippsiella trochoidea, Strain CCMP3099" /LENGTH=119 /DNA_ID=CAMNT_0003111647 /DNA_START=106 /DNA_END=466 /DNA_ORIENTATION=-